MKKIFSLLLVVVILFSFVACTANAKETIATNTALETTTQTTTTTTTEIRTTEDLNTTFKEVTTKTVYTPLKKDTSGSYTYKIGSFSTSYNSSNKERTNNVLTAAKKLNNIVIPSGATFSFNQTVGKRTEAAGYQEASVISNGEFTDGMGGGICQTSSTLFGAVLRSNLKIVERHNHTVKVTYVDNGSDATVSWGDLDFQFKNPYDCDIRISFAHSNGKLTCSIYAKEKVSVGKVNISIKQDSKNKMKYTLTRTVDGKTNYTTNSTYKNATSTNTTTTKKVS